MAAQPLPGERWIDLAKRVWRRVASARTRPVREAEVWPVELTGRPPAGQGEAIFLHLLATGRGAFGVELAFRRLLEARIDYDATVDAAMIEAGLEMSNEMHALFVHADSFWDNLRALRRALPGVPNLGTVCDSNAQAARTAETARDHVEHIADRICDGRPKRRTVPEMPAEVFRRGVSGFAGRLAYFGDELFDVVEIHDAVMAAQSDALKSLEGTLLDRG